MKAGGGEGKLVVVGGGVGSDLLRSGHDLQDLHLLSISYPPDTCMVELVWTQVSLICCTHLPRASERQ